MPQDTAGLLVLPDTAPRWEELACLTPWFAPVVLLRPPGVEQQERLAPLERAGLLRFLEPADPGCHDPRAEKLRRQLDQWQRWIAEHQGSGRVEALKAGLPEPPRPETVRSIRDELAGLGRPRPEQAELPPEVSAGLLLYLDHLQCRQKGEAQNLLERAEAGERRLGSILGLDQEPSPPPDYQQALKRRLPPLDFDQDQRRLLDQRLAAWATLARDLPLTDAWPATLTLEAAQVLMERRNQGLAPPEPEPRSPAGASQFTPSPQPGTDPGSPLAREALSLALPIPRLDDASELVELADPGGGDSRRQGLRQELAELLRRLASEPPSARLQEESAGRAEELSRLAGELLPPHGGLARLSVFCFPGLDRRGLVELMLGRTPAQAQGNCLLLALWHPTP